MKYEIIFLSVIANILCSLSAFAAGMSDGLVGYWPLDGNGKDESGNRHDALLKQGADWTNKGWVNGALELDGAGGHAVVDDKFELVTTAITVVARINGWKTIDWSGIVVGRSGLSSFWLGFAANNTLTYAWNNNAATTWD